MLEELEAGLYAGIEATSVGALGFEVGEEALNEGVGVGVARAAHAGAEVAPAQQEQLVLALISRVDVDAQNQVRTYAERVRKVNCAA